jgi:type IV pilus assembly protein PilQ
VRAAQYRSDLARVVIDLERNTPYSVSAEGNAVTVLFGSPAAVTGPAPESPAFLTSVDAANAASASLSPAAIAVEPAKIEPAKADTNIEANPAPAAIAAPKLRELKIQDRARLVEVAHSMRSNAQVAAPAVIPAALPTASMAITEIPVPAPVSLARPIPAAVETTPAAKSEPAVKSDKDTEIPAAQPAPVRPNAARQGTAPAARPMTGTRYTGEPISVNLKDVDLKDFFRLIHEISGLNVVLDPAVKGTLTIVLDDVPWDQALDIVLQNNGLEKQLDGNVLRIATTDTIKREAEGRRDLAKAEAEAVGQVTATRVLSYAKATALRDTLKRFLSSRGDILSDERSNTLIIRDIPSVLPDIDALIKQLDRKSQQVEIEARVVSASRSFSREIGTQFGIAAAATNGRNIFGGLPGNASMVSPLIRGAGLPAPPLVSSGSTAMPLVSALGALAPTSGFSFAHSSPNFALDFIISAAEAKGVGKLLSKPKVITQNNEKATVKQGSKIPVQTVINNTISTQFIDAVLKLEVTPQITAEGTVYMEVVVENTAIDNGVPRVQNIPALSTQSAETKVLVNDGGTVVIGGVIISNQRTDVAQVPLLGSIPIIGHLFKRTTVSTSSQELLFFLTPRIVPT